MNFRKCNLLIRNLGKKKKSKVTLNDQLANGIYKLIIPKFQKSRYDSPLMDNTWGADFVNTQ